MGYAPSCDKLHFSVDVAYASDKCEYIGAIYRTRGKLYFNTSNTPSRYKLFTAFKRNE